MVQKGKKKSKKCSKSQNKKVLVQCGDSVYKLPIKASSDPKFHEKLLVELKEELEKIYLKYLEELSVRLKNLQQVALLGYEPKEFKFMLQLNKVNDLQCKVKRFIKSECVKPIYNIFYITIHKFLSDIKAEILNFEGFSEEFIVICLAEALNSLECSAKELGKITESLPEHAEIELNCENITKIAFFERILQNFEEILAKYAKTTKNPIVINMHNLLIELKKDKKNREYYNKSFDSQSETSSDISQKSIEEIMSFIDGNDCKNKEKTKKKQTINGLDQEIEYFKKKLEAFEGTVIKLKPNISHDWISSLKLRLKNNRN